MAKNILEPLKRYRKLLEKIVPCGCTPEEAWEDKTNVFINAPRALLICGFQSQVSLLLQLEKEGLLK